ncbi:hypothetical protein AB0F93_31370 [Micromonospora tulbaghiae]|uniref:hypothetical protein n=1 Tax=Micromonospora tulbaghiae TaxID=479978 RepID=UPI003402B270
MGAASGTTSGDAFAGSADAGAEGVASGVLAVAVISTATKTGGVGRSSMRPEKVTGAPTTSSAAHCWYSAAGT